MLIQVISVKEGVIKNRIIDYALIAPNPAN